MEYSSESRNSALSLCWLPPGFSCSPEMFVCVIPPVFTLLFFLFVINHTLPFEINFRPFSAVYHTRAPKKKAIKRSCQILLACLLMVSHRKLRSPTYKLNAPPNHVGHSSHLGPVSRRARPNPKSSLGFLFKAEVLCGQKHTSAYWRRGNVTVAQLPGPSVAQTIILPSGSEARTVVSRSTTRIMSSNPTEGTNCRLPLDN
jgi:hypothetical protein